MAKVNCIVIVVGGGRKVLIVVFVIVVGEEDRPPRTYGLGRGPLVGVSIVSLVNLGRWHCYLWLWWQVLLSLLR